MRLFASHDWGKDNRTHARVQRIVDGMTRRGHDVWFDEYRLLPGSNLLEEMTKGIRESDAVIVFVTAEYAAKVASEDAGDNVRREFMFAVAQKKRLLGVKFDGTPWADLTGPLAMMLGCTLYVDMSGDAGDDDERLHAALLAHHATRRRKAPHRTAPLLKLEETKTVRERVRRICDVVGDEVRTGEHTHEVVRRLFESMCGGDASSVPLHERLRLLEVQLAPKTLSDVYVT